MYRFIPVTVKHANGDVSKYQVASKNILLKTRRKMLASSEIRADLLKRGLVREGGAA